MTGTWRPVETGDVEEALTDGRDPLRRLVEAEIPAIILRSAYPASACAGLVRRFIDRGLMRDPGEPAPPDAPVRVDIGTSLGNLGHDQPAFYFFNTGLVHEVPAVVGDSPKDRARRVHRLRRRRTGDLRLVVSALVAPVTSPYLLPIQRVLEPLEEPSPSW